MLQKKTKDLLNLYILSGKVSVMHNDGMTSYMIEGENLPGILIFDIIYRYSFGPSVVAQYDISLDNELIASVEHNVLSPKAENTEVKHILNLLETCSEMVIYQEIRAKQHGFINSITGDKQKS